MPSQTGFFGFAGRELLGAPPDLASFRGRLVVVLPFFPGTQRRVVVSKVPSARFLRHHGGNQRTTWESISQHLLT
ncbi:MAG TPA: hypothetical protein VFV38_14960 [Ktedonobacteraceae bacterium]|nr:hypothetical protein [Ktedonobacteraceae bacterium]